MFTPSQNSEALTSSSKWETYTVMQKDWGAIQLLLGSLSDGDGDNNPITLQRI